MKILLIKYFQQHQILLSIKVTERKHFREENHDVDR